MNIVYDVCTKETRKKCAWGTPFGGDLLCSSNGGMMSETTQISWKPVYTHRRSQASHGMSQPYQSLKARRDENESHIAKLFHSLDKDNSGGVELRELISGLKNKAVKDMISKFEPLKYLLSPSEVEKAFKQMDVGDDESDCDDESDDDGDENSNKVSVHHKKINDDGVVTFIEFRKFCMEVINNYQRSSQSKDVSLERAIEILKIDPAYRNEREIEELVVWLLCNPSTKQFFLGQKIPEDILHEVIRQAHFEEYFQGKFVFEQGDVGGHYFVILEGIVDVYVRSEKSQEIEMSNLNFGEERDPEDLISSGRLGTKIRQLHVGDGFGEIAIIKPIGTERSASVVVQSDTAKFFTLTRSVYQRMYSAQNAKSDISEKVQVLMDAFMFSWWPRAQIVQFAVHCDLVRFKKHEYFIRSGKDAEHMYIIASGEVLQIQPIFLKKENRTQTGRKKGGRKTNRVIFPWDWEVLKKTIKPSDPNWQMEKLSIAVGIKGCFDLVGQLPMVAKVPYYFTDARAQTDVVAIKISMPQYHSFLVHSGDGNRDVKVSLSKQDDKHVAFGSTVGKKNILHHMESIVAERAPQQYAQNTMKWVKDYTEKLDEFRIQRVRAAIDSDGSISPITKDMQRRHIMCGRCGKKMHSFGELDAFGKHICPLMRMALGSKQSKQVATRKVIQRPKDFNVNWRKRSPGAPSYPRPTTSEEKRRWAGKLGNLDRFEFFLHKMNNKKPASRTFGLDRPQTVNNSGSEIRRLARSEMVVHKTSEKRLLQSPQRPPLPVRLKVRSARRRSMRALKLHSVIEHGTDEDVQQILLRRQCAHYIMPVEVEDSHVVDDDHDEIHNDHDYF